MAELAAAGARALHLAACRPQPLQCHPAPGALPHDLRCQVRLTLELTELPPLAILKIQIQDPPLGVIMRNMAESAAQNRMSMRLSAAVSRGLRESGAIALAGLALVVLVALLSFNPHDPGFSFTGEGGPVHNRIGPVGAWFADALYFLFGRPAYLLPVILAVVRLAGDARALRPGHPFASESGAARGGLRDCCWWPAARWRPCTGARERCPRAPAAWSAAPRAARSPRA